MGAFAAVVAFVPSIGAAHHWVRRGIVRGTRDRQMHVAPMVLAVVSARASATTIVIGDVRADAVCCAFCGRLPLAP